MTDIDKYIPYDKSYCMSTAPIGLLGRVDVTHKLESIPKLLNDLALDYNHPWPNEDELTKKHRLKMYKRIRIAKDQNYE